ncbi:MAG: restriction endonuclease [Candidatus Pacebacteria bacterium]|nr:restriction endonuclease [Candidatus Paceibacterota bacterium]MDD5753033.1 restriction endonuclease [Candidatus Paceibacterota bacterium]
MNNYENKIEELKNLLSLLEKEKEVFESSARKERRYLNIQKEGIIKMAKERQIGFPWLANAYSDLFTLEAQKIENFLKNKKNPAYSAAEIVKEQSKLRRQAEKEKKIAQYLVEYYENIAPFLVDLKEEVDIGNEENINLMKDYSEEELTDEVTNYLTKEEYRKLPSAERNQIALDRFWKRKKSKWLIGRLYERYVGYLYEQKNYDVEYVGIFKGFEDLGRDLICKKGNNIIIIQCKYWAQFRTIYEKHIFQFFGTVFQYKDENPEKKVKGFFYTSTELSDLARRFSKELNIELAENFKFDKDYPCIKCNVSRKNKEKIYHLPFDQQYDKVKIEKNKGEFYYKTVKEAEDAGFRRAFRYHINKSI